MLESNNHVSKLEKQIAVVMATAFVVLMLVFVLRTLG